MTKCVVLFLLLVSLAPAQMEKRELDLYRYEIFRKRAPAVGAEMPELVLRDLEGKKVALSELWKDRPLVLVGGAYT